MRKKNWIEFKNQNENIYKNNNETIETKSLSYENLNLKIHRETKGKKGKTITIISGLDALTKDQIQELLKNLKIFCSTGGKINQTEIQLQGDMEEKILLFISKH